jgi:hypothetical protein
MYEYHVRRYLPAHIQLPHTFLKSHMPDMSRFKEYRNNHYFKRTKSSNEQDTTIEEDDELYLDIPPAYQPHPSHGKHSMTPFIGSIQVRVRYSFQHPPPEDNNTETDTLSPFYFNHSQSNDDFSLLTTSRKSSRKGGGGGSSIYSSNSSTTTTSNSTSTFHDAIEPRLIVVDDISHIMNSQATSPSTPKPNILPKSESTVDLMFDQKLEKGRRYINLEQYKVDFIKMDGENKKKSAQEELISSDTASIKSHNFGDKNFAFRWINESFEEVAISHPSLDRMIGMVVSPQTRILLRAVVKMFNAFVSCICLCLFVSMYYVANKCLCRAKGSKSQFCNCYLHYHYYKTFILIFQGK